ncbi:MAG: hypothetical protein Q8N10_12500 [Phenylobacterium sp.]|uniref:hypothetical protein n=2 Tax=Phenylobacterium sp. TaxID=1871053 RepID=UPI00271DE5CB|nr:hypothetical protein [Phenylobacterium sp.]MDO9245931.1 hypothetical protein [Phenylobacterium sp.]MDP2009266.1 hypothetical protein [Phenylobacterium sp.]MDP3101307.1 hypothetical protein [Phenylobacterium sp.]MDP3631855.1 hypothetical protein [Phenylobacterium sp.]MDP3867484.1 hypothetical protein [Phenylobacterium sp.]
MSMADLIPTLDDEGLANLRANAQRLENSDVARQAEQAAALLPLIDAELADRLSRVPPKAPPKPRAKKVAVQVAGDYEDDNEP